MWTNGPPNGRKKKGCGEKKKRKEFRAKRKDFALPYLIGLPFFVACFVCVAFLRLC
jgi:hypothetical protein